MQMVSSYSMEHPWGSIVQMSNTASARRALATLPTVCFWRLGKHFESCLPYRTGMIDPWGFSGVHRASREHDPSRRGAA
jgi:hypothetical protein